MEADAFLMCVSRLIMNDYFKTARPAASQYYQTRKEKKPHILVRSTSICSSCIFKRTSQTVKRNRCKISEKWSVISDVNFGLSVSLSLNILGKWRCPF